MTSFLRALRMLTTIMLMTVVLLLCWQTIDIYADGKAAMTAGNEDIYRADDIAARLKGLKGPLCAFAAVGGLTLILHALAPEKAFSGRFRDARVDSSNIAAPLKGQNKLRFLILCAAIFFILLGVMNGSAYDVLVKAITICTECIGLG